MSLRWILPWWFAALFVVRLAAQLPGADAGPPPEVLPADEILARVLERSDGWSNRVTGTLYSFRRLTVIEEFDSHGQVKERDSREHFVVVNGAEQTATRSRVDGDEPAREGRRRTRRNRDGEGEESDRRADRSSRGGHALSRELLERFRFRLLGTEEREGRWTHVLAFEPLPEARGGTIADRIIARLEGRMWVDVADMEPVRVESSLRESVSIGGFLAVLDEFRIEMVRRRLPSGIWVDERVDTSVGGRKLIKRFRGRMTVSQVDFSPLKDPEPAVPTTVP